MRLRENPIPNAVRAVCLPVRRLNVAGRIGFTIHQFQNKSCRRIRPQGNRILKPEHFVQVVFIQCGFQSFGLHPALDAPLVL